MFPNSITSTPLTTRTADAVFDNILASSYGDDISFSATLRALLYSRMKPEDKLFLYFTSSTYNTETLENCSVKDVFDAMLGSGFKMNSDEINIHNFHHNNDEWRNYSFRYVSRKMKEYDPDMCELDIITQFYKKQFKVLCFINHEKRKVAIFVENLDIRKLHYLQCSLLAMLPWYFNPSDGASELEMKLIHSLRKKTSEEYIECLEEFAGQFDFRTLHIKNSLNGFEVQAEKIELERVKNEIQCIESDINHYNERIGNLLSTRSSRLTTLIGLEQKIANGSENSEIMDYFLCNKNLFLNSVNGNNIDFNIVGYLEYFDQDYAETVISNKNSCLYYAHDIDNDIAERIYRAIFIDEVLRVKFCASFTFQINGNIRANDSRDYSGKDYKECMPNPHLDLYRCLGGAELVINELLLKRDYIGAIEQCVAATKNLNLSDSIVVEQFARILFYGRNNGGTRNNVCIELPNGNVVDWRGAIEWLDSQEESNE